MAEFQSRQYAETLQTLEPLLKDPHPSVDTLNLAAASYEAQNETAKAVAALRKAIALAPTDVRNYLDLGTISLAHGSFQVGITVMNAGLHFIPISWRLHAERGVLYIQTGTTKRLRKILSLPAVCSLLSRCQAWQWGSS